MINYKLNFANLSPALLFKGLVSQKTEQTIAGISACLKRPATQEDIELLRDIIVAFKDFPGTVMGADTPTKVLLGKHRMGKTLPQYGSYASKNYPASSIRTIASEVDGALRKTGCIINGSDGYGPDHTFVPASKDQTKFAELLKFIGKLPTLPEPLNAPKLKVDPKYLGPFIDELSKAKLKLFKSTAPGTYAGIHSKPDNGLSQVEWERSVQHTGKHHNFNKITPTEVTKTQKTSTENIFSITLQDTGITDGLQAYEPTINIALDKAGNMTQWDAGWTRKVDGKVIEFYRNHEMEKEIEKIDSFNILKTPDIDI